MSKKNKGRSSIEIKEGDKIKEKENLDNIIIVNFQIKKTISKKRIMNSCENIQNEKYYDSYSNYYIYKLGENEIEDCDIYINDIRINSTYYYDFPKPGNYKIKYKFKKLLKETNYMFSDCNSLTSLDLSNFNTQNVTNMKNMFYGCNSLTSLDLSNFNTQNETNMENMFYGCNSLASLNLSNFNTQNVTNMGNMFSDCNSLTSLDLSNFNTQNVTNMGNMFYYCNSLISKNILNFQNIIKFITIVISYSCD